MRKIVLRADGSVRGGAKGSAKTGKSVPAETASPASGDPNNSQTGASTSDAEPAKEPAVAEAEKEKETPQPHTPTQTRSQAQSSSSTQPGTSGSGGSCSSASASASSIATQLAALQRAARSHGIPTALVCDAGRTQVPNGSITVLGLFGTDRLLDPITGNFPLF